MSATSQFISEIANLDVQLWVEGEKLRYSAPKGKLTPTLLTQMRECKAEIIQLLSQDSAIHPAKRDNLPLSFAQQRLWFLEQLQPARECQFIYDAAGSFSGAFVALYQSRRHSYWYRYRQLSPNLLPTLPKNLLPLFWQV
jgi:hypothetical protein